MGCAGGPQGAPAGSDAVTAARHRTRAHPVADSAASSLGHREQQGYLGPNRGGGSGASGVSAAAAFAEPAPIPCRGRGERGGNGGGGVAGTITLRKVPHAHSAGVTDALGRDLGPIPIRRKRIYFIRHGESAW